MNAITTFQHKIMLILSQGTQPAQALYDNAKDDSRVRRTLKLLQQRNWVEHTHSEKMSDGPGAPMKHFGLTETGIIALHQHEEELERLR